MENIEMKDEQRLKQCFYDALVGANSIYPQEWAFMKEAELKASKAEAKVNEVWLVAKKKVVDAERALAEAKADLVIVENDTRKKIKTIKDAYSKEIKDILHQIEENGQPEVNTIVDNLIQTMVRECFITYGDRERVTRYYQVKKRRDELTNENAKLKDRIDEIGKQNLILQEQVEKLKKTLKLR